MPDQELPSFDLPGLAAAVERLPPEAIDALPFGVIRLDAGGNVTFYNATERRQSGYQKVALGKAFFSAVAPCMDNELFRGRIEEARAAGHLDIAFGYVSDMPSGAQDVELDVRVQSASAGGYWIFLLREASGTDTVAPSSEASGKPPAGSPPRGGARSGLPGGAYLPLMPPRPRSQ